ncbi:hypothetical protein NL676_038661 [Syzygium grande]|nr:hypothetical protein NL676_038661 [Syzygium grande]
MANVEGNGPETRETVVSAGQVDLVPKTVMEVGILEQITNCTRRLHAPPPASPPLFKNGQPSDDHLISLCKRSLYREALEAFDALRKTPDSRLSTEACVGLICACSGLKSLKYGRRVHDRIRASGVRTDVILDNHIVNMYGKCGSMADARKVFDGMRHRNVVSWTSLIAGYSQNGQNSDALQLYFEMLRSGFLPDHFTFGSVLKACSGLGGVGLGMQLHAHVVKSEFGSHLIAQNALIAMYTKVFPNSITSYKPCATSKKCFVRDVPFVTSIAGFATNGHSNETISYFNQLRRLNFHPDDITVRSLFCACMSPSSLRQGKQMHSYIIKMAFVLDISVCNALVTMYAKCSNLMEAFKAFEEMRHHDDLISWNAILVACMQHKEPMEVFKLFKLLLISEVKPDYITLTTMIGAYTEMASLEMGNQFGHAEEALKLYEKMRSLGVKPNEVTIVGVLTACCHVGLVEEGWELYKTMELEHGIIPTKEHSACVVDLLARAGHLYEAKDFIKQMEDTPDIVVWKALLAASKTHKNLEIGRWAAENLLKLDPLNATAHVLLCSIYASTGHWDDVGRLRSLMRELGVSKVPGQSWIEIKSRVHAFLADDNLHPERDKIYQVMGGTVDSRFIMVPWKRICLTAAGFARCHDSRHFSLDHQTGLATPLSQLGQTINMTLEDSQSVIGLICFEIGDLTYLCNISTGEVKALPPTGPDFPIHLHRNIRSFSVLGFDPVAKAQSWRHGF